MLKVAFFFPSHKDQKDSMATTVAVSPSEYLQPSTTTSQVRAHNSALFFS